MHACMHACMHAFRASASMRLRLTLNPKPQTDAPQVQAPRHGDVQSIGGLGGSIQGTGLRKEIQDSGLKSRTSSTGLGGWQSHGLRVLGFWVYRFYRVVVG